jgi:hypothetical protein
VEDSFADIKSMILDDLSKAEQRLESLKGEIAELPAPGK